MTEFLPCKNTSCKSFGSPHPNCRCYGYAEGGGVEPLCNSTRMHDPKCKYFNSIQDIMKQKMTSPDPSHSTNGYIASEGLPGLINLSDVSDYDKYATKVSRGHKKINDHVDALFSNNKIEPKDYSKARSFVEDWILNGALNNDVQQEIYKQNEAPQNYAQGGEVKGDETPLHNSMLSTQYPEQNLMLQSAKGTVGNYLQSLKPEKNASRLAFDPEPDHTIQNRSYKKAVGIAANPLSILSEIKNGTIEPEHVKHFNSMYPEFGDHLQKKLTEKITEAQLQGDKPSYGVRQGLSLFMGAPLSSEFTAGNIASAQAAARGLPSQSTPQTQTKTKSKTSTLTKSDQSFLTQGQALQKRQQKQ